MKRRLEIVLSTMSLFLSFSLPVGAAGADSRAILNHQRLDAQQQQLQQEQESVRQAGFAEYREVRLPSALTKSQESPRTFPIDTSCFPITHLSLTEFSPDNSAAVLAPSKTSFDWALSAVYASGDFQLPHCVGEKGIGELIRRVQNAIIDRGFMTTRVLIQPQDLQSQQLVLTVVPGRVNRIVLNDHSQPIKALRGTVWSALPVAQGDVLNSRAIEQGLENLRRPAHVEANIQIVPSQGADALPGESDLHIDFKQHFPYRLSVSLDDSGSRATGRLQGNATLSVENLFSLNDVLYGSFTRHVGNYGDDPGRRGSHQESLYYAVPWQYWLLSFSLSGYRYHQTVSGAFTDYQYAGRSVNMNLGLSRVLYRDSQRKTTASVGFWHRKSHNYINHAEIEIQRRRMAGWYAGISHREYLGKAVLEMSVNYKRGTGAKGAIPAPEERFGEGTSRPRIVTASINIRQPFSMGEQALQWSTHWRAQWNRTPLLLQDMLSIGGRYTVRGFDGELTLMGERGWVWRNELGWNVMGSGQELYAALDMGRVSGPYTQELLGDRLIGAAIGVRGHWRGVSYDWFVGKPLKKPSGFKTAKYTTGFNLSYQF